MNRLILSIALIALVCTPGTALLPALAADDSARHKSWEATNTEAKQAFEEGKYSESETLYRTALDQAENLESSGPKAISSHGLARVYHKQGRYKEAEPLYKTALAIFDGSSRRRIFYLYSVIEDYADMLAAMGRSQEAQELRGRLKRSAPTTIR